MPRVDILLVSLGTTLGWRQADRLFLEQLQRAGVAHRGRERQLRAGGPPAARLSGQRPGRDARGAARARDGARTPRAARDRDLVHHRRDGRAAHPDAVRGPARRPRAHEPARRAQRAPAPARAARPRTRTADAAAEPGGRRRAPGGVGAGGGGASPGRGVRPAARRARIASPSRTCPTRRPRASTCSPPAGLPQALPDARLEVYGLDPEWARAHLRRAGVPEPSGFELRGTVPAAEFRARIRRRARLRGGRALGGLRPGAARGAGRRRAARDGAVRRPVRGAAAGARARRAGAHRPGARRRGARRRHQGRVRAAATSASGRTAPPRSSACARSARRPSRRRSSASVLPRLLG